MEKMKMESANITDMNIDKIAALFPNCITETADENGRLKKAINFDMLRAMLSEDIAEGDEAYEFTWVGKKAAIAEANRPIRKTLRPCVEESVNWDTTENLYIEGDNLEVLKLLQESYLGKVKMIYIDPPYNTGNDFIYRDDFAVSADDYAEESGQLDEDGNRLFKNTDSNGRFHSDWCSMIYSRLMLARNLLSDDGVIFISIDDNEVENLKKICDEVFGATNFVGQWNWYKSATPPNLSKKIKKNIEYILCYEKQRNSTKFSGIKKTSKSSNGLMNQTNSFHVLVFPANCVETGLSDGVYKAGKYGTQSYEINLLNDVEVNNGLFITEVRLEGKFKWGQENLEKELLKGTKISIRTDSFSPSYDKIDYDPEVPPNLIDKSVNVDTTEQAGKLLDALFDGNHCFDYPKPVDLLKYLMGFVDAADSIILDFFSGSATTAHAVMQLNAEDGGHRKFIMVQLPEKTDESSEAYKAGYKNICEIGKERIRRAGTRIKTEIEKYNDREVFITKDKKGNITYLHDTLKDFTVKGENINIDEWEKDKVVPDIGFRVLKLDDTNMQDVYYTPAETTQTMLAGFESNIKPDRTDLDLLFGCLLDWGLPLSMPYSSEQIEGVTVHTYNDGDLIACFDKAIPESVIKTIAKRQPLRVVFRDDSFADSPSKINVSEIFKMLSPDTRVKVI